MTSSLQHNFTSLRKFKDKGRAWIAAKTDVVAIKIERLMIMCNGYNKIQPVRLSRGVATMVPQTSLMRQDQSAQYQFRPCLGSRRRSRGREARCEYYTYVGIHCDWLILKFHLRRCRPQEQPQRPNGCREYSDYILYVN